MLTNTTPQRLLISRGLVYDGTGASGHFCRRNPVRPGGHPRPLDLGHGYALPAGVEHVFVNGGHTVVNGALVCPGCGRALPRGLVPRPLWSREPSGADITFGREDDMKIPQYWAKARHEGKDKKGHAHTFVASGWSFVSLHEARDEASARAKRIFELITAGRKPERYEYHDRPIKEEVLKKIGAGDSTIAVVTRNRYGALILNCTNALFVDVDFPRSPPRGLLDGIRLALSRKRREARQQATAQAKIAEVEQWARRNADRGFRLYRTKEGLRLLFTDRLYDPVSAETAAILAELKADPLYVTLTRKQECFRARLTSKPWRCGASRPPNSFPWDDPKAEAEFRKWEAAYAKCDAKFKVCDLIREFGAPATIESLRNIVDVHDRGVRVTAKAELA